MHSGRKGARADSSFSFLVHRETPLRPQSMPMTMVPGAVPMGQSNVRGGQ